MKTIDGRKAEIIRAGKLFSTYREFARKHGYSDAAAENDYDDKRRKPQNGDIVTLLTSGPHLNGYSGDTLWIVETTNGERHIINEKGLRILGEKLTNGTVVLKDETIGNVEREYREVKRPATEGERIKIVNAGLSFGDYENGDILTAREPKTFGYPGVYTKESAEGWSNGFGISHEEYVVLEPSDIVRVDGVRYRLVERKAAEGDVILIIAGDIFAGERFQPGRVYRNLITIGDDVFVEHAEGHRRVGEKRYANVGKRSAHYRVLEPVTSVKPAASDAELLVLQRQLDTAGKRIAALEKETAGLTDAVAKITLQLKVAREDIVLIEEGVTAGVKATAATRDEIDTRSVAVARAKADVAELSTTSRHASFDPISFWPKVDGKQTDWTPLQSVEFVVNRERRTVVVLIKVLPEYGGRLWARGIAKAAPGDCFNVHIGKVIALRRALRLDVPTEYVNAPQPTEPRVGDVVLGGKPGTYYSPSKTFTLSGGHKNGGFYYAESRTDWIERSQVGAIIDDSREDAAAGNGEAAYDRSFPVGSRVRIIGNGSDGMRHNFDIDDMGEIVSGPDKGGDYRVKGIQTRELRRSKRGYDQYVSGADMEAA